MDQLAEKQTLGARPEAPEECRYRLHVPEGREMVPQPRTYETLEQAKQAFEAVRSGARWCLIGAAEPDRKAGPFGPEATSFVAQGRVEGEKVTWRSLVRAEAPAATPARPPVRSRAPVRSLREHLTSVLTPQLGFFTAEEVVRHVCTQLQIEDSANEGQLAELREFLRRGLPAYVAPELVEDLVSRCAPLPLA